MPRFCSACPSHGRDIKPVRNKIAINKKEIATWSKEDQDRVMSQVHGGIICKKCLAAGEEQSEDHDEVREKMSNYQREYREERNAVSSRCYMGGCENDRAYSQYCHEHMDYWNDYSRKVNEEYKANNLCVRRCGRTIEAGTSLCQECKALQKACDNSRSDKRHMDIPIMQQVGIKKVLVRNTLKQFDTGLDFSRIAICDSETSAGASGAPSSEVLKAHRAFEWTFFIPSKNVWKHYRKDAMIIPDDMLVDWGTDIISFLKEHNITTIVYYGNGTEKHRLDDMFSYLPEGNTYPLKYWDLYNGIVRKFIRTDEEPDIERDPTSLVYSPSRKLWHLANNLYKLGSGATGGHDLLSKKDVMDTWNVMVAIADVCKGDRGDMGRLGTAIDLVKQEEILAGPSTSDIRYYATSSTSSVVAPSTLASSSALATASTSTTASTLPSTATTVVASASLVIDLTEEPDKPVKTSRKAKAALSSSKASTSKSAGKSEAPSTSDKGKKREALVHVSPPNSPKKPKKKHQITDFFRKQ